MAFAQKLNRLLNWTCFSDGDNQVWGPSGHVRVSESHTSPPFCSRQCARTLLQESLPGNLSEHVENPRTLWNIMEQLSRLLAALFLSTRRIGVTIDRSSMDPIVLAGSSGVYLEDVRRC